MQLNKVLKGVILALPVITVTNCSSHFNQRVHSNTDVRMHAIENKGGNLNQSSRIKSNIQDAKKSNIIYFDYDSYATHSKFEKIINFFSDFLCHHPSQKLIIEGYADERGTPEYNIALGEHRANSVKIKIESKGVPTNQIAVISYGEEKPAVLGHNEAAYAKNRRAILQLK